MAVTATAVATEVTISSKSRNLGLGWSNGVERIFNQRGESSLRIAAPTAPAATGGLRTIVKELAHAGRANSGNDWSARLFVGGQTVDAVWDHHFEITGQKNVIDGQGRERVDPVQTYRGQTWMRCAVGDLIDRLRAGETLRVRLVS